MKFYTTEKIGPKRSKTPEGFLLCEEVPIARTGMMRYKAGETPIPPDADGIVLINRTAEEVFKPETIASFEGKSLVNEHPGEDVTPANWKMLTGGIVLNVRRGLGTDDNLLLADLLITDQNLIEAVDNDKREVSCGYDCDYYMLNPGRGEQRNIIGNHVALVEIGRCGSRCAIGDQDTLALEEKQMTKRDKFLNAIRKAFKTNDAAQLEEAMKDMPIEDGDENVEPAGGGESHTHIHLHQGGGPTKPEVKDADEDTEIDSQIEQRVAALEEGMAGINGKLDQLLAGKNGGGEDADEEGKVTEKELEAEGGEMAGKAKDSAPLSDAFQETVSLAEIIAPGIKVPTFDSAAAPKKTYDSMCALRRKALILGTHDAATSAIIEEVHGKELNADGITKMTCDAVRPLFRGVASAKKVANNNHRTNDRDFKPVVTPTVKSVADLNKLHREKYSPKR